jgi:hypothetical protein
MKTTIRKAWSCLLCAAAILLVSVSCSESVAISTLSLDIAAANQEPLPSQLQVDVNTFKVIRCSTYSFDGGTMVLQASKSLKMKATYLLFIDNSRLSNAGPVPVAVVPVTGKEYEYDSAAAVFYWVSGQSVASTLDACGVAYADWEYAVVNGSEKLPCCE